MTSRLTPKQELYVQALVSGASQRTAYKAAYSTRTMRDKTVDEKASRLFAQSKIRARYDELMADLAAQVVWDRAKAANSLIMLLEVSGGKVERSCDEVTESVMTTDRTGAMVSAVTRRVPADVPAGATRAVIEAIRELNKIFQVYDEKGSGTGEPVLIDDFAEPEQ